VQEDDPCPAHWIEGAKKKVFLIMSVTLANMSKDKEIEALRDKLKDLTRVHHSTLTELRKQVGPP